MECKLFIDKDHKEEVLVYARKRTRLTDLIEQACRDDELTLIGYKGNESVVLDPSEVHCFIVEDNKIYALTESEKLQLKCRLYNLEEMLSEGFIKINQSCIANVKMISRFDASFSGSLTVKFKNGYSDYVSRRNLKNVKERLGL